ncbi:hypothetical protein B0H16DRAFT_1832840, partial [Mycena metata]
LLHTPISLVPCQTSRRCRRGKLIRNLDGTVCCDGVNTPTQVTPKSHFGQEGVSGPQMVILEQSGNISDSEDEGKVSEILHNSTDGGVASSDTSASKGIKTRKQKNCEKAKLIWQGLYKLTGAIALIVPSPFDTPLKIFNAISDVAEKYFDNEEKLKEMMDQLSSRLIEANCVLLRSDDYGIDGTESSKKLASVSRNICAVMSAHIRRLVVDQALEIHTILNSSFAEKTMGQDKISQKIYRCLDSLKQGTEQRHRTVTHATAKDVHKLLGSSLSSQLSFVATALFNAGKAGISSRRACTPETRENLLDRLEAWSLDLVEETSTGPTSVFWLSGMAGTGKSTIAYTLCERLEACGRLGASFFCSRNEEQTRSRQFIIPTIVRQLISAYKPLIDFLRDVPLSLLDPVPNHHINKILVNPWSAAWKPNHQAPLVIVIDALDEIEDNQGAEFIKELITSLSQTSLRGLKFLLTSRPHPDIVKSCHRLRAHFCLEEINPREARADIHRFLCNEFPNLREEALGPVVEESAGIFIYAATVVRHLRPPGVQLTAGEQKARLKLLRAVGFGKGTTGDEPLVDSLYQTVTREALRNRGPEIKIPQRILYAVVTASHPLTVRALASLVVDAS